MSKFRVGQRVRIKWSYAWPELNGTTGVIVDRASPYGWSPPYSPKGNEWKVAPDSWGTPYAPPSSSVIGTFCPGEEQLEPATDCYDKTEWDACVWKPEHLRVGA